MRSWLFVPADRPSMIAKARRAGADAVIIDLEDSVAPEAKPVARDACRAALDMERDDVQLWVRINALTSGLAEADIAAVMAGRPDGLVLPKALGGACIQQLATLTDAVGAACPPVLAIATETASALFGLGSYGGLGNTLAGLAWGAEDLSADLGSATSRDGDGRLTGPYALARNLMLAGAVAAGVQPVDTVWTDIRDLAGLEAECLAAQRDGFTGKMAIHPAQVPVINRCFTPSAEDIAMARRIVDAFRNAPGSGVVALDGRMVDMPHLKRSERILARAAAFGAG